MKGVSVIICCYNSAGRIGATLQFLFAQVISDIQWEIILVDNNCQDQTIEIVQDQASKHETSHLIRIVEEKTPGLSFAREKGINESKYDLIVFCDDDNWLAPDYIMEAVSLMDTNPQVNILGGVIEPKFETEEPAWFKDYAGGYAVGNQGLSEAAPFLKKKWVYGAGMVIRKRIFSEMAEKNLNTYLTGRNGSKLAAGDDSEMCSIVRLLGGEVAASNKLNMKHYIQKSRLQLNYALQLYAGFGRSLPVLDMYESVLENRNASPYNGYVINRLRHYTAMLSPGRLFLYQILKPAHPYLVLPHVIMFKNAMISLFRGVKKNAAIYKEITSNFKNV